MRVDWMFSSSTCNASSSAVTMYAIVIEHCSITYWRLRIRSRSYSPSTLKSAYLGGWEQE